MGARLSKDERRTVAQRVFAALCAHYPDHNIALFEHPQVGAGSRERALTTSVAVPSVGGAHDGTDGAPR
jgi:hypothetical protein